MANRRIVIVVRKDLELPVGLAMAQAAHLCDEWLRSRIISMIRVSESVDTGAIGQLHELFENDEIEWMKSPTVSVLAVNTLEELNFIESQTKQSGLPCHSWVDTIHSGLLDRYMENIKVGIAIGPINDDIVKTITGKLPLY
jgi:peptidyl-tRNA hydrolase